MGPARFHCATLLLICKSSGKKSFNRHSRITFSFDSFTCAFCIKTFSLRDAHFTLNICVLRVSFICVYNPFQKKKKVESLPNYSVLLGMESLELLSVYVILKKKLLAERGFDPRTSGLWAQHASTAPLCC